MNVRFAEAARHELNDAALWLELQEAGLGERFLLEVAQAAEPTPVTFGIQLWLLTT